MSDSTAGAVFKGFGEKRPKSAVSKGTVDLEAACSPTSTLFSSPFARPNCRRGPKIALSAVGLALAVAACGSSSKQSANGASRSYAKALEYSDCMRAHGMPNFPDPGSTGTLPSPALPAFRAARKACAKLQPAGLHLGGPPAPSAAELRAARAFARCIRAHGFSHFPDPLATYGPGLTLARGEYFPPISTIELQSPAFTQAAKACGVHLPEGAP